jgi:hypothetical protein
MLHLGLFLLIDLFSPSDYFSALLHAWQSIALHGCFGLLIFFCIILSNFRAEFWNLSLILGINLILPRTILQHFKDKLRTAFFF